MGVSRSSSVGSELPGESDVFLGVPLLKSFQFTGSSAAKKIPTLHCKNH